MILCSILPEQEIKKSEQIALLKSSYDEELGYTKALYEEQIQDTFGLWQKQISRKRKELSRHHPIVHISFPLFCDDEEEKCDDHKNKSKRTRYYREETEWNIMTMPSPAEYAANVALEFGLSWHAMLDLENSIERQLERYVEEYMMVANIGTNSSRHQQMMLFNLPCVTLIDAAGTKRNLTLLTVSPENKNIYHTKFWYLS